jgi:hypothetical protein
VVLPAARGRIDYGVTLTHAWEEIKLGRFAFMDHIQLIQFGPVCIQNLQYGLDTYLMHI